MQTEINWQCPKVKMLSHNIAHEMGLEGHHADVLVKLNGEWYEDSCDYVTNDTITPTFIPTPASRFFKHSVHKEQFHALRDRVVAVITKTTTQQQPQPQTWQIGDMVDVETSERDFVNARVAMFDATTQQPIIQYTERDLYVCSDEDEIRPSKTPEQHEVDEYIEAVCHRFDLPKTDVVINALLTAYEHRNK